VEQKHGVSKANPEYRGVTAIRRAIRRPAGRSVNN
jgi:hypothetical protein